MRTVSENSKKDSVLKNLFSSDVKYRFESFNLYDYLGVEKHLKKMAQKGWKLDKVSPAIWRYRRIEPTDLTYAITYVPDASEWNPEPTDSQLTLEEYCAEAGWEKIGDWEQMQIFCSDEQKPIPIETDETLRLDMIEKSMKKSFLPAQFVILIMMTILLVQHVSLWFSYHRLEYLAQDSKLLLIIFLIFTIGLILFNLVSYFSWSKKSKQAIEHGDGCVQAKYQTVHRFSLVVTGLFVVTFLVTFVQDNGNGAGSFFALYLGLFFLFMLIIEAARRAMRRLGLSKIANLVITFLMAILLAFAIVGITIFVSLSNGWLADQPAAVYTNEDGIKFEIYRDELPLTVEDLQDVTHPNYSYQAKENSSILVSYGEYRQNKWGIAEPHLPWLDYEVTDVKVAPLYDFCLNSYLEVDERTKHLFSEDTGYKETDAVPWSADTAYQNYIDGVAVSEWILCKNNCIVWINTDMELDETQMAIVGEKLLNIE